MTGDDKTILVVEDQESNRILIEAAFRDNGVRSPIHFLHNGTEAIAYLTGEGKFSDRHEYDVPSFIITDLEMPGGDGFEVLEHRKSHPDCQAIPTVVLSSSDDRNDVNRAYLLGATGYLVKASGYEALRRELKVLYDYWMACQAPEVHLSECPCRPCPARSNRAARRRTRGI